ncbi:hypothetical protein [Allokutzneria oryzae]|uniref:Uncharacterized protein n=1 Tax=Allokutzneria oryzae TaxID=1378989 RepID=A0ABV5ZZE7_9PSEU
MPRRPGRSAAGTSYFAPLKHDPLLPTMLRNLMRPPFTPALARELVIGLSLPILARGHSDLVAELALPLAVVSTKGDFTPDTEEPTSNT